MTTIPVKVGQKHLVLGDFQTGKSTFADWLSRRAPRALIFDPVWEYDDGQHLLARATRDYERTGRGVFQPHDAENTFEPFCRYALGALNCLVVVDEPTLVMDSLRKIPPAFNRLYRLGHKRGIGVTLATHRIRGDLPTLLRLVHHFWIFRTTIESDLDTLLDYVGVDGVAWLQDAPDWHFYHRSPSHSGPVRPITPPGAAPGEKEKA